MSSFFVPFAPLCWQGAESLLGDLLPWQACPLRTFRHRPSSELGCVSVGLGQRFLDAYLYY
jgi:hypothetical protein